LVDAVYLKKSLGSIFEEVELVGSGDERTVSATKDNKKIFLIEAKNSNLLKLFPADLVINIASFQEMNPPVIKDYLDQMQDSVTKGRSLIFYHANRLEKQLPDGTISRVSDYPISKDSDFMVDELCPRHQDYYSFRLPFFLKYDGPHIHQLIKIA